MKAPSTAVFTFPEKYESTKKDDAAFIRGFVESQNGFGAMCKSDFEVFIYKEKDQWKSGVVKIDGKEYYPSVGVMIDASKLNKE